MNQLNNKIESINLSTLVIGVDIAKNTHIARAVDYRGIELGKALAFENNIEGFAFFLNWINLIMDNYNKNNCIIGMEPTGHYWFNLGDFVNSQDERYKLVLVNPHHVKKSKELDDNNPTKNDRKDALTIARLIKDGRYVIPADHDEIFCELRSQVNLRESIVKEMSRNNSKINKWADVFFPEYNKVFTNLTCMASLLILKFSPLPKEIVSLDDTQIVQIWRSKISKGIGVKKAAKLKNAAQNSVGRNFALSSAKDEIAWLVDDYERLESRLESIENKIRNLLNQIPYAQDIINIKGLGEITVASILSETGDLTRYWHGKQLQKLAGLNLRENSSGMHEGETTITKRGRRKLRAFLFRSMLPLLSQNAEFRLLHQYYTTRKDNPLKKMQSLIALCCKLLRIIHGMALNCTSYNAQEVIRGIDLSAIKKAAA
jgi:transposase